MARNDLPQGHGLSMASEDYLEAIYRLSREGAQGGVAVRSVDVAEQLGVSKASVSKALSTLRDAGMVEQVRYGRVTLTSEGERYGRRVWRSHRALRAFLTDELGVDEQVADEEACLMEHYLSQDTIDRWCDHLERQGIAIG
ncbi:MAG: metal-dependent transcriptional regulator [Coriobacteriales bacterium]|nr:metal-dependent transcriptional regulator [Coriobacteriales bacterium]